jgi:hypothetical protein
MIRQKLYRKSKHTFYVQWLFFLKNHAVHEIMRKNNVEPDLPQMTVWRMLITFCVPKATNTYSEYVILIAFLLKQWLHTRSSILRYTYVHCLSCDVLDVGIVTASTTCVGAIWGSYSVVENSVWGMTLRRRFSRSRRFGGTWHLHPQGLNSHYAEGFMLIHIRIYIFFS